MGRGEEVYGIGSGANGHEHLSVPAVWRVCTHMAYGSLAVHDGEHDERIAAVLSTEPAWAWNLGCMHGMNGVL